MAEIRRLSHELQNKIWAFLEPADFENAAIVSTLFQAYSQNPAMWLQRVHHNAQQARGGSNPWHEIALNTQFLYISAGYIRTAQEHIKRARLG